ncbi:FtsX-like permease family protein [Mesomycoplasma hyopneumoniae]
MFDKFKSLFLFLKTDFKTRGSSTLFVLIFFLINLLSLNLFFVLDSKVSNFNSEKIQQYQLDSVELAKKKNIAFFDKDFQNFENQKEIAVKVLPIFPTNNLIFIDKNYEIPENNVLKPALISSGSPIELIDESDFFRKRFFFDNKNLKGHFIKNENEIILSKTVIDKLKIIDPIGKIVKIHKLHNSNINKNPTTFEVIIAGVNYLKDVSGKIPSFIHYKLVEKINQKFGRNDTFFADFDHIQISLLNVLNAGLNLKNEEVLENIPVKNLILETGKIPENKGELLLSTKLFNSIKNSKNIKIGDFIMIDSEFGQAIPYKISGVFNPAQNSELLSKNQQLKSENLVIFYKNGNDLRKTLYPSGAKIFLRTDDIDKNLARFKAENPNFIFFRDLEWIKIKLLSGTFMIKSILLGIQLLLLIALITFSVLFSKNLVRLKTKSIGILKSLGLKKRKILIIHLLNILVICGLMLTSGLILTLGTMPYFYTLITNVDFGTPSLLQIFINFIISWFVISLFVFLIYFFISLKVYKKPITELLRYDFR